MSKKDCHPVHQLMCSFLAVYAVLGCWSKTADASSNRFDQIYVFGDSLSDIGNKFKVTRGEIPPSPPYRQGRFSDGPVWVEYLASRLELNPNPHNNFAFGGATTGIGQSRGQDDSSDTPGLLGQIKDFTAANPNADPQALYIVWAGANDYLEGATNPAVPLANLSRAVRSLAAVGAQNILIVNLPDLGKLPAIRNSPFASTLNNLTRAHNSGLLRTLETLNQSLAPNTSVTLLDAHSLFNQAIADPARFGFTNVTTPCLINAVICDHPDKFLFWDSIHPTTAGHQVLGKLAFFELTPESISEPLVELAVLGLGTGIAIIRVISLLLKKRKPSNKQK